MACHIEGTFHCVKDEGFVKYLVELGTPEEEAKKFNGSHWTFFVRKYEDKWVYGMGSDQFPGLSNLGCYKEGVDIEDSSPFFGGKYNMRFVINGNVINTTGSSEKMGAFTMKETYSADGVNIEMAHPDKKASRTEFWCRSIKEEGDYRFEKEEGMADFIKASGQPKELYEMTKHYKLNVRKCGHYFIMTECWGQKPNVYRYKLDEETEAKVPGYPELDRMAILTKTGNGKYTMICTCPKTGKREQWDFTFCEEGCLFVVKDHKTGASGKIWTKRYTNISGEFRVIAQTGLEEVAPYLGIPCDFVSKVKSCPDQRLSVCEKEGGFVQVKHCGSGVPSKEWCFKFDEEYELEMPGLEGKFKVIDTRKGNSVMAVARGPKFTIITCFKYTDNFLIKTSHIAGTHLCTKSIYERLHCN